MGIKSVLATPLAAFIYSRVKQDAMHACEDQHRIFKYLLSRAAKTKFGQDHHFNTIKDYKTFTQLVPIRDYEGLRIYVDEVVAGAENILWPGKPIYFAKTSGTTSGTKYIPITKESIPYHISSARNALLCYVAQTGKSSFVDGKLIFLSGSPELETVNGILTGRLSGIVNHHVPGYLRTNQMPSYQSNCIEDWEQKVDAVVKETINQPMTLISGIPPWVQMYFDKLLEQSGKKNIHELFNKFELMVYGGVNFEPYRAKLESTIGKKIHTIETYPASEGFIAYQDTAYDTNDKGLLLLTNNGMFYEFVQADTFYTDNPKRVSLKDVELDVNYVLILNTNAGLWGYNIGDTIKFVSKDPYRILITGRIKHFISAFGEHVIGEEVEYALMTAAAEFKYSVIEFTVAPQVTPDNGSLPYHEWFVEFDQTPTNMIELANRVDELLREKNTYYDDLRKGNILQTLKLRAMPRGTFIEYMKSQGKLGGQNKLPRLSNDRKLCNHQTFSVFVASN
jgi:hypothetical protein